MNLQCKIYKSNLKFCILFQKVNPKLTELVSSLSDTPPAGPLVALCRTYDQATALVALINTLADRQSR